MPDENLTNTTQQPLNVTTPPMPLATVFGDEEEDNGGMGMGTGAMASGTVGGASDLPPLPTEITPAVSTPAAGVMAGGVEEGRSENTLPPLDLPPAEEASEAEVTGNGETIGSASDLPPLPSLDSLDAMITPATNTAVAETGGIVEPLPMPTAAPVIEEPVVTEPAIEPAAGSIIAEPVVEEMSEPASTPATGITSDLPPATLPTNLSATTLSTDLPTEIPEPPAPESAADEVPAGIEPVVNEAPTESLPLSTLPEIPLTAEMPVPVVPTPDMTVATPAVPEAPVTEMTATEPAVVGEDLPMPNTLPSLESLEAMPMGEQSATTTELPTTLPDNETSVVLEATVENPVETAIETDPVSVAQVPASPQASFSGLSSINDLGEGGDEVEDDDGTPSLNEMLDQADQVGEEIQVPSLTNVTPAATPQATKIINSSAAAMQDIDVESLSKLSPVEIIDQQLAKVEDELGALKTKASKLQQVNEELKKEIEQKQYSAQVIEYSLNSSMSRMNELEQQKQDLNAARAQVSGGGGT